MPAPLPPRNAVPDAVPPARAAGALVERLKTAARSARASVIFPESTDPRVLAAAACLAREQIARPILVGAPDAVSGAAERAAIDLPRLVEIVDPATCSQRDRLIDVLLASCRDQVIDRDHAARQIEDPVVCAAALVRIGAADACVAGVNVPTAAVLRAALTIIGPRPGIGLVSSAFLMVLSDGRGFTFADCAVVPNPDAHQLSQIALAAASTHREVTGETPRVAMLSFSTMGSAHHDSVVKVRRATELVRAADPTLAVDGELQFDAALLEAVARRKAPHSTVAGRANVFIFPNLDAGNIAYKITERLAAATAIGPLLQGLARPMHDLSRGCTVDDIVTVATVAALQGAAAPRTSDERIY